MGKYDDAAEELYGEGSAPDLVPVVEKPAGKYDVAAQELYGESDDPFSTSNRKRNAERWAAWKTANEDIDEKTAVEVFHRSQATGWDADYVGANLDNVREEMERGRVQTQIAGVDELQKLLADSTTRPMVRDDVASLRGLWGMLQRTEAKSVTKGAELIPLMISAGAEAIDRGPEADALVIQALLGRGEDGKEKQQAIIEGMRLWWRWKNRDISVWGEETEAAGETEVYKSKVLAGDWDKAADFGSHATDLRYKAIGEPTDEELLGQALLWARRAGARRGESGGVNRQMSEELEEYIRRDFGDEGLAEGMLTSAPGGAMELFWDHSVQAAGAWLFGALGGAGGAGAGPGGVAAGATAGALGTGIAWDTAQAGPQLYLTFRSMRNPDGSRMHTDEEARQYAWITAAGSGAVTAVPGVKVLEKMPVLGALVDKWKTKGAKVAVKKALGEVGEEIIESPGVQRKLLEHLIEQDLTADIARKKTAEWMSKEGVKRIVKDGIVSVGSAGVWTGTNYALQGAAHATGVEVSKAQKGQAWSAKAIWDQTLDTAAQGLHDTMLVMSLGPGRATIDRMVNIGRSRAMGEHLTDILAQAEESKLRQVAPVVFEQFTKDSATRKGEDALWVEVGTFNAGLERLGEDPGQFAAAISGDGGRSYRHAVRTGGKVKIQLSAYTAKILGTPVDSTMREGMTLDPDQVSPIELERFRKMGEGVVTGDETARTEFVAKVRQAIIDRTLDAETNQTLTEIETSAEIFASQIQTAIEAYDVEAQDSIIEQIGGMMDSLNIHGPASEAVAKYRKEREARKWAETHVREQAENSAHMAALKKMGLTNAVELAALKQKAQRKTAALIKARAQGPGQAEKVARLEAELAALDVQHRKLAGIGVEEAPKVVEEQPAQPGTAVGRIRLEQAAKEMTRDEKFKAWFGDSKVVDADGKPMVVYHATRKDFAAFLPVSPTGDVGIHFGTKDAAHERLAGTRGLLHLPGEGKAEAVGESIIPAYLSIQNPLLVGDPGMFSVEDTRNNAFAMQLRDLGVDVQDGASAAELVAAVEAAGYDGFVYVNEQEGGESWAALRPEQIKSIHAREFDPTSPVILEQPSILTGPALEELTRREEEIRGGEFEVLHAIRQDGTVAVDGLTQDSPGSVALGTVDLGAMTDSVVTHNHPSDSAPMSPSDASVAISRNVAEMRIVVADGSVHSIVRPEGGWPTGKVFVDQGSGSPVAHAFWAASNTARKGASEAAELAETISVEDEGNPLSSEALQEIYYAEFFKQYVEQIDENLKRVSDATGVTVSYGREAPEGRDRAGRELATEPSIPLAEGGEVSLEAGTSDTPKGVLTYSPEVGSKRTFDMLLFDGADVSTLSHELFHFFGEIMAELAAAPDAPATITENYDALARFMGYESGAARSAERVEKYEERGTYAFEQYLAEGKAPTAELAPAFHAMKRWMLGIWRNFVSRGESRAVAGVKQRYYTAYGEEINLTPEARAMFDRLLAGEDVVNRQAQEAGIVYDPAVAELMDEAERVKYEHDTREALSEAQDSVASQVQLDLAKRGLKETQERVDAEVAETLDQDPAYRAEHYLRTGLHLEDVHHKFADVTLTNPSNEAYGISRRLTYSILVDAFAVGKTKKERAAARKRADDFVADLPSGIFTDKRSVETPEQADALAKTLGYADAREMFEAMRAAEPRAEKEARLVEEALAEEFGDIITNPEGYAEKAAEAVHNPKALKQMTRSLNAIRKKLGYPAVVIETLEKRAQQLIDEMPISELSVPTLEQDFKRLSYKVQRETEAGNWDAADQAKTEQIITHHMIRKAKGIRKKVDSAHRKLKQASKEPWRSALGRADQRYLDPSDALLQAVGIMATPETGDVPLFSSLAEVVAEDDGVIAFDVETIEQIIQRRKPWESLTTEEALQVRDAIRNIRALANERNSIDSEGETRDWHAARTAIIEGTTDVLAKQKPFARSKKVLAGMWDKARRKAQHYDGLRTAIELVVDKMDGEQLDGPWHRFFFDGYVERRNYKDELAGKYLGPFVKLIQGMSRKDKRRLYEPVDTKSADGTELLPMTPREAARRDGPLSRMELIMALVNLGNKGNQQRLLDGRGWDKNNLLEVIERNLTADDVKIATKIWETLESLYPMIEAIHQKESGLKPGRVQPQKVDLVIDGQDITLDGGYFPAAYDPDFSEIGEAQETEVTTDGKVKPRPVVNSRMTKKRADKVSQMITLDFSKVVQTIDSHLHYIAYRRWVKQANKILRDPEIREAVKAYLGEEREPFLQEFVDVVAGDSPYAFGKTAKGLMADLGATRAVFASAVLGMSVPIALGDYATIWGSMTDFGSDLMGNPAKRAGYILRAHKAIRGRGMEEAQAKSKELQHRRDQHATRYTDALRRLGITSDLGAYYEFCFALLEQSDMRASAVIWQATYEAAVDEGYDPGGEAIKRADKVVRRVQPKLGAESPAMMRHPAGLLFAFFSYMINVGGQMGLMRHRAGQVMQDPEATKKQKRTAVATAAASLGAKYVVEMLVGDWISGRGPEGDEDEWEWFATQMLAAPLKFFPIVGDVGEWAAGKWVREKPRKFKSRHAPNLALFEMIGGQIERTLKEYGDGELSHEDAIATVQMLLVLAPRRPQRSAQFLADWESGKARVRNPADVAHGLIYGTPYGGKFQHQSPFATVGTAIEAIAGDAP